MKSNRRSFIQRAAFSTASVMALGSTPFLAGCNTIGNKVSSKQLLNKTNPGESSVNISTDFKISLAQWSLHKSFFGDSLSKGWGFFAKTIRENPDALYQGTLKPDDFPNIAIEEFGINTIELVNTFYYSKANDNKYWDQFKKKCDDLGVSVGLIMCDALGNTGDENESAREQTLVKHHAWVDIAKKLGAHSIRVNAAGQGSAEDVAKNVIDGLKKLTTYGQSQNINIIVENHGGYSSDGQWLSNVIKAVDSPYCGTLPDFGNFCIERTATGCAREYDRYKGIEELLPLAKGLSAKSYDFDNDGNETSIDFVRIMKLAKSAGYKGHIGIEYEGSRLSEFEGIVATKSLLEKSFNAV